MGISSYPERRDVSGLDRQSGVVEKGSRGCLRLVTPADMVLEHVIVTDLEEGEDVLSVIEAVRTHLGKSWDALLEIAEIFSVKLIMDEIGGQRVRIKPDQFGAGLELSREKNKQK